MQAQLFVLRVSVRHLGGCGEVPRWMAASTPTRGRMPERPGRGAPGCRGGGGLAELIEQDRDLDAEEALLEAADEDGPL